MFVFLKITKNTYIKNKIRQMMPLHKKSTLIFISLYILSSIAQTFDQTASSDVQEEIKQL